MKFKFTLLTSWTLLPTSLPDTDCEDDEATLFVQYLTEYTENKYGLNVFCPKQRGEAFLQNSFHSFEERFLTHSEYALLIVSGQKASCLDHIYPRFLVFFTAKKSWTERVLIIFLKQPTCTFNFDVSLLKHPPILFNDDSTNQWINDEESWLKITELIKHRYIPSMRENLPKYLITPTKYNIGGWMSVTDLRGQPLAVRITNSSSQTDSIPSSWHDLTGIEPINRMKNVLYPTHPIGQRLSQSAGAFGYSPTQSHDSTPSLHLHVNNYFNRNKSVSPRCFTRKSQYYNTITGLDPCCSNSSKSQYNIINDYHRVKCQIDETSHYENSFEQLGKHNFEINFIYKTNRMCIPHKKFKIKSCEFLNESILSCKLSNRNNKSTDIINDGSEYSSNVLTPNRTTKHHHHHHDGKIKFLSKKHLLFKNSDHICIPSKKFLKLFKFRLKKDVHSVSEKFGIKSQLELAKAVKTLSDVGQNLVEHSKDTVNDLNPIEIQQPSCSYNTIDKPNLSSLSIHIDMEEEQHDKSTNNNDSFHDSRYSQSTPIQSMNFADSGLWSMSQITSEDCTNSLQQHLISCSESPVFDNFTDNNNNNNNSQTNEIPLQKSITNSISSSYCEEMKPTPWLSIKALDKQSDHQVMSEKSKQTENTVNQQFVNDQTFNASINKVNEFESNKTKSNTDNNNHSNVTQDLNNSMNSIPFNSNSVSFEESKPVDKLLHSHISTIKPNDPKENLISSISLSKVDDNDNGSSSAFDEDSTKLSTFQQNSLVSSMIDSTLEQRNRCSRESYPLNADHLTKISSKIDSIVNSSIDLQPISVENENNPGSVFDIQQNMNRVVILTAQIPTKSLMKSTSDTLKDNSYFDKSFNKSINNNNVESIEYHNVINDYQTNKLQSTDECLPKQFNEQLTTTTKHIEDIMQLLPTEISTSLKQEKVDSSIVLDHLNVHDVCTIEQLNVNTFNEFINDQLKNNQSVPSDQIKPTVLLSSHEDMKSVDLKSNLNNTQDLKNNSYGNLTTIISNEPYNKIDDKSETKYDFDDVTDRKSNDTEKLEINKLTTDKRVSTTELSQLSTVLQPDQFYTPIQCQNRNMDILNSVNSTTVDHLQDSYHPQTTSKEQSFVNKISESNVNKYYTNVIESLNDHNSTDQTKLTKSTKELSNHSNSSHNNTLDIDDCCNKVVIKTENDSVDSEIKDLLQRCSLEDRNTKLLNTTKSSSIQIPISAVNKPVNYSIDNDMLNEDSLTSKMKLPTTSEQLLNDDTTINYALKDEITLNLSSSSSTNNYSKLKVDQETDNHLNESFVDTSLGKQFHHEDSDDVTVFSDKKHDDRLQITSHDNVSLNNSKKIQQFKETSGDPHVQNDYDSYSNTVTSLKDSIITDTSKTMVTTVVQCSNQSTINSSLLTNEKDNFENNTFTEHNSLFPIDSVKQFDVLGISTPDNTDSSMLDMSVSLLHKETKDCVENDIKFTDQLDLTSKDEFSKENYLCTTPLITAYKENDYRQLHSIDFPKTLSIGSQKSTDDDSVLTKINDLPASHNHLTASEQSFMKNTAESSSSTENNYCMDKMNFNVIKPFSEITSVDLTNVNQSTAKPLLDSLFTVYKEEDYAQLHNIDLPKKAIELLGTENSSLSKRQERSSDDDNDNDIGSNDLTISPTFTNKTNIMLSSDISDHIEIDFNNSLSTPPPSRDSVHSDYSNITNTLMSISSNNSMKLDLNSTVNKLNSLIQHEYHLNDSVNTATTANNNNNNNNIYWTDSNSLTKDIETTEQPIRSILVDNSLEQSERTLAIYNTSLNQLSLVAAAAAAEGATESSTHAINEIYIDDDYIRLSLDNNENEKSILEPEKQTGEKNGKHKSNQRFIFTSQAYCLFTAFFNLVLKIVQKLMILLVFTTSR
ncbi:unnamed protein product [Schistosoma turkestanicum]|nr:unnamed protein product [Schistosoma turkestanicum]